MKNTVLDPGLGCQSQASGVQKAASRRSCRFDRICTQAGYHSTKVDEGRRGPLRGRTPSASWKVPAASPSDGQRYAHTEQYMMAQKVCAEGGGGGGGAAFEQFILAHMPQGGWMAGLSIFIWEREGNF